MFSLVIHCHRIHFSCPSCLRDFILLNTNLTIWRMLRLCVGVVMSRSGRVGSGQYSACNRRVGSGHKKMDPWISLQAQLIDARAYSSPTPIVSVWLHKSHCIDDRCLSTFRLTSRIKRELSQLHQNFSTFLRCSYLVSYCSIFLIVFILVLVYRISLHIHMYVYRPSNCCYFFFTGVTVSA